MQLRVRRASVAQACPDSEAKANTCTFTCTFAGSGAIYDPDQLFPRKN
jgi:hypothetical protein